MAAQTQSYEQTEEQALRNWNRTLGVWRLCENQACRRARICRGNPLACMPRLFPQLPLGVQAWFVSLGQCQDEGLTFEEAMEELEGTPQQQEFIAWLDQDIANRPASAGGPGGRAP
jgi:hypothetical protein